jgi:hypothetical protein
MPSAVVVAGTVLALTLAGGCGRPRSASGPSPASQTPIPATTTERAELDGFLFGYLPPVAVPAGVDSHYTAAVGPDGLGNPGSPPAAGEPSATVAMRRFTAAGQGDGSWMFVSVLRPLTGSRAETTQIGGWLTQALVSRADRAEPFDVAAGRAYLLEHQGTEATSHSLVITTPGGTILTVEGAASLTAVELRRIAMGVVPG